MLASKLCATHVWAALPGKVRPTTCGITTLTVLEKGSHPTGHTEPALHGQFGPMQPGALVNIKIVFPCIRISIIKIRQLYDHLIFITGILMLVKWQLYIEIRARIIYIYIYMTVPLWRSQFSCKYSQKTSHSSPIRVWYRVSFLGPDWYFASVPAIIYAIFYYNGLHYNGTWLYMAKMKSASIAYNESHIMLFRNVSISISKFSYSWSTCHTLFMQ